MYKSHRRQQGYVRASSINTDITTVTALAISNALVALSGAVIAQTQALPT